LRNGDIPTAQTLALVFIFLSLKKMDGKTPSQSIAIGVLTRLLYFFFRLNNFPKIVSLKKWPGNEPHRENTCSCGICVKAFIQKDDLAKRKRIHKGEPYPCDICVNAFSQQVHLTEP
jgi:hypothetical protein